MAEQEWKGGELLFAGGTDFFAVGRHATLRTKKKTPQEQEAEIARQEAYPNLPEPYRLKGVTGKKIKFVASGPAAAHVICIDMEGVLMAWGRNEKLQLGLGDRTQRNMPVVVPGMAGKKCMHGACGKFHTVVVTDDGKAFSWGFNGMGQTGTGEVRLWVPKRGKDKPVEEVTDPKQCMGISDCSKVSCGGEFTMWLCDGKLFAAGNPQSGQLGDGSDHSLNVKDSSIKIMHEPQGVPQPVPHLPSQVMNVACGVNHTVCVTDEGYCYTWGSGNYGRLGHKIQQDEFAPRLVETLSGRLGVPDNAMVGAGGNASFCDATTAKTLYAWGKLKISGDGQMYPQAFMDMAGWNVRSLACGPATYAIAAEKSAVTWGAAHNNELGYGPNGKKSSANPAKVMSLEGYYTHQVAAGVGFILFLAQLDEKAMEEFPVWESEDIDSLPTIGGGDDEEEGKGKAAKRKGASGASAAKKARK